MNTRKGGKTIFITETEYEPLPIRTENLCDAYGSYWFTAQYFNALFRLDKTSLKAQYVCVFPNEESKGRMYSKVLACGNKIYAIPLSACSIGVYDLAKKRADSIPIKSPQITGCVEYDENNKFFDACIENNYVYLFPHRYPAVIKFNLIDNKVEYYYNILREVENPIKSNEFYFSKMAINDEGHFFFSNVSKKIYKFNFMNMHFEKVIDTDISGIAVIVGGEDKMWIYSHCDNCVYMYKSKAKSMKKIKIRDKSYIPGSTPITRAAMFKEYVYFSPGTANYPIKIDTKTDKVSIAYEIQPSIKTLPDREIWKMGFIEAVDNRLLAFDATSNELLIYDYEKNETKRCDILHEIGDDQSRKVLEEYEITKVNNKKRIKDLQSLIMYIR